MNINDFVMDIRKRFEDEIRNYIHTILEDVITKISENHDIPIDILRQHVQSVFSQSVRKCSVITKMGHECKYDTKCGHSVCIKHFNMTRADKQPQTHLMIMKEATHI